MNALLLLLRIGALSTLVYSQKRMVAGQGMEFLHQSNPRLFVGPTLLEHPMLWGAVGFVALSLLLLASIFRVRQGVRRMSVVAVAGLVSLFTFFVPLLDPTRDQYLSFYVGLTLDLVLALGIIGLVLYDLSQKVDSTGTANA